MDEVLFFGCWSRVGHHLWTPRGQISDRRDLERIGGKSLDGDFAPHLSHLGYCNCPQIEGSAALHHLDGWTILSFWDRSIDRRKGSNSSFLARGELSFGEMVAVAKEHYPEVWRRYSFAIELSKGSL